MGYVLGSLLVLAVFLAFVAWPAYLAYTRRQVAASWSEAASELGLEESEDDGSAARIAAHLAGAGPIHHPALVRQLTGEASGTPFAVVMFTYVTRVNSGHSSTGDSGANREGSAVVVEHAFPQMRCMPSTTGGEDPAAELRALLGRAVPGQARLVTLDDPEFDTRIEVKGPDAEAIREALTPAVRAFLLEQPQRTLMGTGSAAIWWVPYLLEGEGLSAFVEEARQLCHALRE